MSRLARQGLIVGLLALYLAASHCGAALHAALEKNPSHHDHGASQGSIPTISGVSHDCLICEFQAQGQVVIELPRPATRPLGVRHVTLVLPLAETPRLKSPCHPRAPPSVPITIV